MDDGPKGGSMVDQLFMSKKLVFSCVMCIYMTLCINQNCKHEGAASTLNQGTYKLS